MKDESYYNYVKKLIKELNIERYVIFVGNVPNEEMPKIYSASDLVVVPQIWKEGALGLTVLEAMACERAVITYDLGGIREVLDEHIGGLAKPTPEDLANKIIEFISKDRHLIGSLGRKRILKFFSLERATDELIRIYSALRNR